MTDLCGVLQEGSRIAMGDADVEGTLVAVVKAADQRRKAMNGSEVDALVSRRSGRWKRIAATSAVAAASLVIGGFAVAQTQPSEQEVAEQYDLTPFEGTEIVATVDGFTVDGARVDDPDCRGSEGKVTAVQKVGDNLYCITADSLTDAWVIGQQLQGHTPTEAEIAEKRESFGE